MFLYLTKVEVDVLKSILQIQDPEGRGSTLKVLNDIKIKLKGDDWITSDLNRSLVHLTQDVLRLSASG